MVSKYQSLSNVHNNVEHNVVKDHFICTNIYTHSEEVTGHMQQMCGAIQVVVQQKATTCIKVAVEFVQIQFEEQAMVIEGIYSCNTTLNSFVQATLA